MSGNQFEYLSGTVSVSRDAPGDWETRRTPVTAQYYSFDLPFWSDPNNDAWGVQLCRILYHESLHFWLLFSSSYIASLVADEWSRLLRYEETGVLSPPTEMVRDHFRTLPDNPFSAADLVECWARYWDVHTRSPDKIIREEVISIPEGTQLRNEHGRYSGAAYDLVMLNGEDCAVYGRPYRWLLSRWESRLAALIFPIITHAALSTCRPVLTYCFFASLLSNLSSSDVKEKGNALQQKKLDQVRRKATWVVNLDWLQCYGQIVDALVRPWLEFEGFNKPIVDWLRGYGFDASGSLLRSSSERLQMPIIPDGICIIQTSSLKTHPIFREYVRGFLAPGWVKGLISRLPSALINAEKEYAEPLVSFVDASPTIMLALPGQPPYRYLLGYLLPPPKIVFRNLTWHANRPAPLRLIRAARFLSQGLRSEVNEADDIENTYKERSEMLEQRVRRFRAAEKAVSLGLPPNTFDT